MYKQIWDNLCALKFTGQSIFSFVYYASFDAQPRAVHADNDNGRHLSSQALRFNRTHPMVILIHWPSSDFTIPRAALCATHIGYMCIIRTRNALVAMK